MTPPAEDRRPPLSPQLALRVAIAGMVALGMFAIIFFRLWYLQVLSGSQYVQAATVNRVREVPIPAPRGEILDRSGNVLVDSVREAAVVISPEDLPVPVSLAALDTIERPPRADTLLYNRLARVLRMRTRRERCHLYVAGVDTFRLSPIACMVGQQLSLDPVSDVTVASGPQQVPPVVEFYLAERQAQFPGVSIRRVYTTNYPYGTLAAQVLGTVGQITAAELGTSAYRGIPQGSVVGQSGLEAQYNSFLQGREGYQRMLVNAFGQPVSELSSQQPVPGENLRTSLDLALQRVGQQSLAESMALNGSPGGAFVAMNPVNGQIYAMGSEPSFNPGDFTHPMTQAYYDAHYRNASSGFPLLNRAIQSAGPTGSTFKPITATAALESGAWSPGETFDDTGQFCVGSGAAQQCRHNAGHAVYGTIDLPTAIKFSSDDFFYHLGALLNPQNPLANGGSGGPLQAWAHRYGIGRPTGVDLPGEVSGTLPSPRWREQRNLLEYECDNAIGPFRYSNAAGTQSGPRRLPGWHRSPKHPPGGCGIADGTNRPWSIGDMENLAVGQGDVQVTPLQLADVYAALANGTHVPTPHIGLDVQSADGTVLQTIAQPPGRPIDVNPAYLDEIRLGLRWAASQPGGTSADVFGNFPEQVYGKTGTAQYFNAQNLESDYAWYACFVPPSATSRPIVVVVWVEKGGFGAVAAAPVARQILSQWFFGRPGPYIAGSSKTL
ncbi:MAG TPA: penicillin-binding transpeptidase domain-containing protein [Solirubrobacteraceae bacterium]|nr:penicillin-binding transpeptidase domain-containing protein [Solirubrobacteraceae bacterium]